MKNPNLSEEQRIKYKKSILFVKLLKELFNYPYDKLILNDLTPEYPELKNMVGGHYIVRPLVKFMIVQQIINDAFTPLSPITPSVTENELETSKSPYDRVVNYLRNEIFQTNDKGEGSSELSKVVESLPFSDEYYVINIISNGLEHATSVIEKGITEINYNDISAEISNLNEYIGNNTGECFKIGGPILKAELIFPEKAVEFRQKGLR
jgi:hypothetical protein